MLGVAQAIGAPRSTSAGRLLAGHVAFLVILADPAARPVPERHRMTASCRDQGPCPLRQPVEPHRPRWLVAVGLVVLATAPAWGDPASPCACSARSSPMSPWPACGTCWPAMPAWSRSASRLSSGIGGLCAVPSRRCRAASTRSSASRVAGAVRRPRGGADHPDPAAAARAYFTIGSWVVAESLPAGVPAGGGGGRRLRHQPAGGDGQLDRLEPRDAGVPDLLARPRPGRRLGRRHRRAAAHAVGASPWRRSATTVAARSNGIDVARTTLIAYRASTACRHRAWSGPLIFLQKLHRHPGPAFSINDWTAYVIFITVIGGIGRVEGPIVGTIVYFLLRQSLADYGSIYIIDAGRGGDRRHAQGPRGLWGFVADRFGLAGLPAGAPAGEDGEQVERRQRRVRRDVTIPPCGGWGSIRTERRPASQGDLYKPDPPHSARPHPLPLPARGLFDSHIAAIERSILDARITPMTCVGWRGVASVLRGLRRVLMAANFSRPLAYVLEPGLP